MSLNFVALHLLTEGVHLFQPGTMHVFHMSGPFC